MTATINYSTSKAFITESNDVRAAGKAVEAFRDKITQMCIELGKKVAKIATSKNRKTVQLEDVEDLDKVEDSEEIDIEADPEEDEETEEEEDSE